MNNVKVYTSKKLNEKTYYTKLDNGLNIYICKKQGYNKKVGMFGTKYGSITNDFIDISTNERTQVPDGVAHFLEHKLFEQEGENALDLFSKEGISANAYTSFDHTVFYFETINKFKKGLKMLIELVRTPYFTKENVQKEKGIIEQEISMYEDDAFFKGYFNLLNCLYVNHNVKIDIAGTKETIADIDENTLYTCYNTFYNLDNMFLVIAGDVNVEETIDLINNDIEKYEKNRIHKKVTSFVKQEPETINKDKISQKLGVFTPQISVGYKLKVSKDEEIIKKSIIAEFINEIYFSNMSEFYKNQYEKGNIAENIEFYYEGSNSFSHVIISTSSNKKDEIVKEIKKYIENIKNKEINDELFNIIKNKKKGEIILKSENLKVSYRRIIESLLNNTNPYFDVEYVDKISKEDIKLMLNELDSLKCGVSIIE